MRYHQDDRESTNVIDERQPDKAFSIFQQISQAIWGGPVDSQNSRRHVERNDGFAESGPNREDWHNMRQTEAVKEVGKTPLNLPLVDIADLLLSIDFFHQTLAVKAAMEQNQ